MAKGIEQLTADNHTLYLRVQKLINANRKWDDICDEIGLVGPRRINNLCEWFIDFRMPKALPKVRQHHVLDVPKDSPALKARGVRLQAWHKQRQGARAAIEALEAERA